MNNSNSKRKFINADDELTKFLIIILRQLQNVDQITVSVPARFTVAYQNVTALKGATAVLDCTAEGDKPVSITWFNNGHQLDRKLYSNITLKEEESGNGTFSRLTIWDLQREHTTTFECVASNKYGSDQMEVKLTVQEPPEPPINVHVNNFTSRSVKLSWEEPYNGNSAITSYIIQYKNVSVPWSLDVPHIEVDRLQQVASLSDLMPAHVYHIRVLAVNDIGSSNYSNILTVTTMEEVPEAPPRDVRVKMKDSETLLVSWKKLPEHCRSNWNWNTTTHCPAHSHSNICPFILCVHVPIYVLENPGWNLLINGKNSLDQNNHLDKQCVTYEIDLKKINLLQMYQEQDAQQQSQQRKMNCSAKNVTQTEV
ncbi:Down syndrome cell adhesion molecule homolog [Schistocerca nitens]|uniref:Down syndrome cell adhesion molecule homolog n=1 Tax=Schistocerca nitens TaxID=7011 RepID=UPI002118502D|nr:Down syndrome cell adhesion molecule homolog [Schistocerca nitens]